MNQELEKHVEEMLAEIGMQKGQMVLDFGCGSGNYAIPAAKIVGKSGTVYAVDKSEDKLSEVKRRAKERGLTNIHLKQVSEVDDIGLADGSVDVVLLYDIFWYFPLTDPKLDELLDAIYRISKPYALISVYPKHVDEDKLKEKIECAGFTLTDQNCGIFLHEGKPEEGCLLNFRKMGNLS